MLIDKIKSLGEELQAKRAAMIKEAKETLEPAFKEVLEQNPEVLAIGWHQYTPYFNDGDTCEFNVHDLHYCTESGSLEDSLYEWPYASDGPDAVKALVSVVNGNEEIMQAVFGDHAEIRITRDGISVDEYDHE